MEQLTAAVNGMRKLTREEGEALNETLKESADFVHKGSMSDHPPLLSGWVSVDDYLPKEGQEITVKGVPTGKNEPIEVDIRYWSEVGLIRNVTHWKAR